MTERQVTLSTNMHLGLLSKVRDSILPLRVLRILYNDSTEKPA